jgi:thiamine pyrophosphate-dependent acetolactate synthase large subunit-like protein
MKPTRSEALAAIANHVSSNAVIVFALGMISRDAFAMHDRDRNLYITGAMGLAGTVGLGIAETQSNCPVVVVEGDASAAMETGTQLIVAHCGLFNFTHIILDNEVNESSGGQKSYSSGWVLSKIAEVVGYKSVSHCESTKHLSELLKNADLTTGGPRMIHVKIRIDRDITTQSDRVPFSPDAVAKRLRDSLC